MKMYLISDNNDTLAGMRLGGVLGVVARSKEEIKTSLDEVLADKEIAVLIVTEKINTLAYELISNIKLNKKLPLIAVIPDRHGTTRPKDFITQYVREAIGIKI